MVNLLFLSTEAFVTYTTKTSHPLNTLPILMVHAMVKYYIVNIEEIENKGTRVPKQNKNHANT